MSKKKIVYIDMDGVLVDLGKAFDKFFELHPYLKERYKDNPDHIQGVFRNPPPVQGAIEAVKNYTKVVSMICSSQLLLLGVILHRQRINDFGLKTTLEIFSTKECS